MGLYNSELNKQIHLRNKQKREWEKMKKAMEGDMQKRMEERARNQSILEQEKRNDDRIEMVETDRSKKLTNAMVYSAQEGLAVDETLHRAVEVIRDQNGNEPIFFLIITNFIQRKCIEMCIVRGQKG